MNWSDFLQNAAQTVIDTRLQVYQAERIPRAVTQDGVAYVEGQPITGRIVTGAPSVSPVVMLAGGAAVVLLAVLLLKS